MVVAGLAIGLLVPRTAAAMSARSSDSPPPAAMCPTSISCTTSERNFFPHGYRIQKLEICGANCSSQYWLSDGADGRLLLATDPVRGGGVVAVDESAAQTDAHPPVRVVLPAARPADAACCPSQFADTTYTWDAASSALIAGERHTIPAADFGGWDALRSSLQTEHLVVVFP